MIWATAQGILACYGAYHVAVGLVRFACRRINARNDAAFIQQIAEYNRVQSDHAAQLALLKFSAPNRNSQELN